MEIHVKSKTVIKTIFFQSLNEKKLTNPYISHVYCYVCILHFVLNMVYLCYALVVVFNAINELPT